MPPYLCYRNFTLHSDCLGIVTIPEIYKYVSLSSLDHLSKVGHDGLLVVGGERVVAGDANSGGSVREVVPGN